MIPLETSNRHGLIAGTTGSGKTITALCLAAHWQRLGIGVVLVDCKGDMGIISRVAPVTTLPVPTIPIGEMNPSTVADLLSTTPAGADALSLLWQLCDYAGRALVTLDDVSRGVEYLRDSGRAPPGTVGALNRAIARLCAGGYDEFFCAPAFLPSCLLGPRISLINASRAVERPETYQTIFGWLIREFSVLPDVGDKCVAVLIVDEAHLLFGGDSDDILAAMRVLRSRGIGVYYVTQSPEDLPEKLLGLLGHKIIHALRIYTPGAMERARILGRELAVSPGVLGSLPTGHAATSILSPDGTPTLWSGKVTVPGELLHGIDSRSAGVSTGSG